MRAWLVSCHQDRNPGAPILAVWFQTDLQPPKQNLCLAPDQKMVRPKKVANDLKINLAPRKNTSLFCEEKWTITYKGKMLSSAVFSTKKGLVWYTPECNERSPTVFSRLPSLMAADKPCPQLQPFLAVIMLKRTR